MERSPLPSERAEFSGKMLNATHRQKHIEQDAQLLENRIALLKKEEQRAWRKIQQTKKRADEIVSMRRENEARQAEKKKMAEQAEEREKVLAAEHHKLEERARLARAKNLEQMYLTKRSDVQKLKQERKLIKDEVKEQRASELRRKEEKRYMIKKREEDIREARADEERRIAEVNEKKYNQRVKDREVATRKKEKEVSRMERVEMQLIQKLKNTQQLQQQAFQELENALNGEV